MTDPAPLDFAPGSDVPPELADRLQALTDAVSDRPPGPLTLSDLIPPDTADAQRREPRASAVLVGSARYRRKYRETKKMHRRRSVPIMGYCGPNGSGKTLAMVRDVLPSLDAGRRVLSTVMLLDSETGEPHPCYERLTDWDQVLGAKHADLLFDEITGIAGSREAMGMPVEVQNLLNQLRRNDLRLGWTAPDWKRADTILRSVTQAVSITRGYWSDRSSLKGDAGTQRLWFPKRLFKVRTFSAIDFDEWTAAKGAQPDKGSQVKPLRPDVVEWFRGPDSRAFASYDTLSSVSRIGTVLDSGRCASCGGKRSVPVCRCGTGHTDDVPARLRLHGRRAAV